MVSRMRTGILSDEMSVKLFPLEQSISLKQAYLAPRVGDKIFIPKKAKWMIKNLNLPYEQEQQVLKEFLRKSQIQEINFCCGENKLNTRSLETFALGRPTASRENVAQNTMNALIQSLNNMTLPPAPATPPAQPSGGAGPSSGFMTPPASQAGPSSGYMSPPASRPDNEEAEDNRQLGHELSRRRGLGQNWYDNPEVFEPRQGQNIATPQPRRETIRLPGTPPPPLRERPSPSQNPVMQQLQRVRDRLTNRQNP